VALFAWGFVGPGHAGDGHTCDTGYGPEEAAAGAEMLVLRARGIGGFRGLLLGSVSRQCRHHAPAPLAIVRRDGGGRPRHCGRIVVGGRRIAEPGGRWTGRPTRPCAGLPSGRSSTPGTRSIPVPCPTAGYPLVSAVAEEQARCMLDTLLAEHGLATSAVVRARSVQGAAASVRVDAAAGADLPLRSRHRRRR
jgi:hypothetical protein